MRAKNLIMAMAALVGTLGFAATPARAVVVDGIAAVVNGEIITIFEMEKAGRAALGERLRNIAPADLERVRHEILQPVLDQLVLTRLQAQRARQLGLQISDQEIDKAIANIKEDNKISEEVLERLLQERGLTREEYRREIQDQIRLSKLVQYEIRARVTVPGEEIAAWFAEHRQEWYRPERIRVRHLLVPLSTAAPSADIEAARTKALALRDQARGGADFAALVRAETPGSPPGADPVSGEIARGELFPALEAVAFELAIGAVSDPVQSPAGFHLVQVTEKIPAYQPTLEDVRSSIEEKIGERKTREAYAGWLKQLRAEAIVEIRY